MRPRLALASVGLVLSVGALARAAQVETLRNNGPVDKRFNIAVLGDGYRVEDQTKLTTDATAIIDYLFNVAPLKQYAQFFNVKLVHVISKDNGADKGSYGADRDTALGAHYECVPKVDRLLCIDTGLAQQAAAADVKEFNFIMVLVNDTKYGGAGGSMCVASSNESSFEILSHEIGHSLADLADEYSDAGSLGTCGQQDCPEANVTLRTQREQIKWKDWLEQGTPVPTPAQPQYGDVIGLFEGARYQPTGVYRPKLSCKMRSLGADYCSVCSEQFVKSIWTSDNIQMIESSTPAQPQVQSDTCEPIKLGITSPPITPSTYKYVWTLDGNPLPETTSSLELAAAAVMNGSHQVKVAIQDSTSLVRHDPDGVLKDEHSWTVAVSRTDCVAPGGVGGTGGGGLSGGGAAGSGEAFAGAGAGGVSAGVGGVSGGVAGVGGAVTVAGSGATPVMPSPPPRDSSGCGCAVPGSATPRAAALLAGLGLASLIGRRRARR